MFNEGNAAKAKTNIQKHGLSFGEVATVFLDPLTLTFPDPYHSCGEEREITIGYAAVHQVAFVSRCQRVNRARSISARKATRKEQRQYEESIDKEN